MKSAGPIQYVRFHAPENLVLARKTSISKIPMPTLIEIRWTDGEISRIVPYEIGRGRARDVLGGTIEGTDTEWGFVLKVQYVRYHDTGNGHEYDLGTGVLRSVAPQMVGWIKIEYPAARTTSKFSVLVVARVAKTMHACMLAICQEPASQARLRILLGHVEACIALLATVGRVLRTKPPRDLYIHNIGITKDDSVVLLDLELAANDDLDQKRRWLRTMKKFFDQLHHSNGLLGGVGSDQQTVVASWLPCIEAATAYLAQWWPNIDRIPTSAEITARMAECITVALNELARAPGDPSCSLSLSEPPSSERLWRRDPASSTEQFGSPNSSERPWHQACSSDLNGTVAFSYPSKKMKIGEQPPSSKHMP